MSSLCKVASCDRPAHTRGWCSAHYKRVNDSGSAREDVPLSGTAMPIEKRLAAKSEVSVTGCRLWIGAKNRQGYGCIGHQSRQQGTHRVAWMLERGIIPNGLFVLHRCDTPACINVDHLFLGTALDNGRDMASKGRGRGGAPKGGRNPMRIHKGLLSGENNGSSKLTLAQVVEIRNRYSAGEFQTSLAAVFGVRQCHISRIVRGESWAV